MRAAARVTVLTGAGVSAASGVPTFRGADGLWRRHRPEDLATPDAFARDPRLVWEWYDWRRQRIAACAPNDAHHVLARWAGPLGRHAGHPERRRPARACGRRATVIRLHGSIWEVRCASGCAEGPRAPPARDGAARRAAAAMSALRRRRTAGGGVVRRVARRTRCWPGPSTPRPPATCSWRWARRRRSIRRPGCWSRPSAPARPPSRSTPKRRR